MMETNTSRTAVPVPIRVRSHGTIDNVRNSSSRRSRDPSRRDWREGPENSISTSTTITSRRRRKKQKPLSEKVADWFRAFLAFLFSNVGIVCLVVGYTIAGAFIFEAVEGSHSHQTAKNLLVSSARKQTAIQLWQLTSEENIFSEKLWKTKVDTILQKYQDVFIDAVIDGWDEADSVDNGKWTFAGAFLYSLTVITTIGYGNTCPRTIWGKVITIGYAIVGMPLFLLYLSNIGDILAKSFKWIYARCFLCRCRKRPRGLRDRITNPPSLNQQCQKNSWQTERMHSQRMDKVSIHCELEFPTETHISDEYDDDDDDDEDDDESYDSQQITVPLTICLSIMVGYICGGAILFSEWEEWNFLDGSYFCFVSLSTIGFGDIVPGNKIYSGKGIELSFIFCSMYLMLGMALIAMCFNLMQEEVMAKIRSFTKTVKHILRCDR